MRTIAVDSYPLKGPFFSSAVAAIKHAQIYEPLVTARADEKLLAGSQLIDGYWSDTDFVIRFSNGKFLRVYVNPQERSRNVYWSVTGEPPELPIESAESIGAPPLALRFSRAGTSMMDRSGMMAARRGKDFKQFWVNEFAFYVYTPRQLILSFSSVFRVDTGDNLLFVCEDD